ncbi:glycosyltransferase, partial [Neisseria meningitidis]|nr:glycosyltransferase [Neisseria meningitidis]
MPSEAFRRHRAYRENKLQPLVSVLICAYNVEKYFAQSLAAVVNQTWRNLDILIVDDGSTDGTLAIAQRFQEQDGRIRILAHGLEDYAVCNKYGIELYNPVNAEGRYIGETPRVAGMRVWEA